ncbi:unnamed protein product [Polarella glacialis]|uniref:Helicase ATP-binding domain-containing protein n=1 Tax=Polarella glacialis TaxID=89957 RepID=A0A813G7J7_POLGL|nr:unnamed protein product [Polarella glacialis]
MIAQDLQQQPSGRHVIFVPWCDLAWQTAKELRRSFGIDAAVLGAGETEVRPDAKVVVCVYNSAHHLQGQHFRIKVVDEAHHLDRPESWGLIKFIRKGCSCELSADFSATFRREQSVDFRLSFDKAVQHGWICDFRFHLVLLSAGDRMAAICALVVEHCSEWAPMFVLKALCVVGVFNEGISVPELRTVVFGDARHSRVNIQQVAMRVSRLHASKHVGEVIFPVALHEYDEVQDMLRTLSERFKTRIREDDPTWFRMSSPSSADDEVEEVRRFKAEVLGLELLDSLGKSLSSRQGLVPFQLTVQRLKAWTASRPHELPSYQSNDSEEKSLARWLMRQKVRFCQGKLAKNWTEMLRQIPALRAKMVSWEVRRCQNLWAENCQQLEAWVQQNTLSKLPLQNSKDKEEYSLSRWLAKVRRKHSDGKLSESHKADLVCIEGMAHLLAEWQAPQKNTYSSFEETAQRLEKWVREADRLPGVGSKSSAEKDLNHWLNNAQWKHRKGRLTFQQLECLYRVPGMREHAGSWRVADGLSPTPKLDVQSGAQITSWEGNFHGLLKWVKRHAGKALPKQASGDSKEKFFANWLKEQGRQVRLGQLSQEATEKFQAAAQQLPAIAKRWSSWQTAGSAPKGWEVFRQRLELWVQQSHELPSFASHDEEETCLAAWLTRQRRSFLAAKLSDLQLSRLTDISGMRRRLEGWTTERLASSWGQRCQDLRAWFESNAFSPPRKTSKEPGEKSLAIWLQNCQQKFRRSALSDEEVEELRGIAGMEEQVSVWEVLKKKTLQRPEGWEGLYKNLRAWSQQHNNGIPSMNPKDLEESELAAWLSVQWESFLVGELSDTQIHHLSLIPGSKEKLEKWKDATLWGRYCELRRWEQLRGQLTKGALPDTAQLESWLFYCTDLLAWAETSGRLPSLESCDAHERTLAAWLSKQVQRFLCGQLSAPQLDQLCSLQEIKAKVESWSQATKWDRYCDCLRMWIQANGEELPKQGSQGTEEKLLAAWLSQLQQKHRKQQLGEQQLQLLRGIPGMLECLAGWEGLRRRRAVDVDRSSRKMSSSRATGSRKREEPSRAGWEIFYQRLVSWLSLHGDRLPSQQTEDKEEKSLAVQLSSQRRRFLEGQWTAEQLSQLEALPALQERLAAWRTAASAWDRNCSLLGAWMEANASEEVELPKRSSKAPPEEQSLAVWLKNVKQKLQQDKLAEAKLEQLRAIPGLERMAGWESLRVEVPEVSDDAFSVQS